MNLALNIGIIILLSQGKLALASSSEYISSCDTAKKFELDPNPQFRKSVLDWTSEQLMGLGYTDLIKGPGYMALELGSYPVGVLVYISQKSCKDLGAALESLKKLKASKPSLDKVNKIVFVFFDGEDKSKVKEALKTKQFIAELNFVEQPFEAILKRDQAPSDALKASLRQLHQDVVACKNEITTYLGASSAKSLEGKIEQLLKNSSQWPGLKVVELQTKLQDFKSRTDIKDVSLEIKKQVLLFDQVRKGLWEDAQRTVKTLAKPNEQVLRQLGQGKQNLEEILKQIKAGVKSQELELKQKVENLRQVIDSSSI